MRRIQPSKRWFWLLPAGLAFVGAAGQVMEHRALLARIARGGFPGSKVPPTMLTEHPAAALALVCVGLILVLLALRPPKSPAA